MKKLMLIAAAVVAIAACTKKKDVIEPKHEISFELPVLAPNTKAVISGTVLPQEVNFKVAAISHEGDFTAWSAGTTFMDAVTVDYNERADGWHSTGTKYYWPSDNKKLSFQAYAPASVSASFENTGVSATFTTPANPADAVDFLVSDRVVNKEDNAGEFGNKYGVQLPFHHTLSQIAVTAILEGELPLAEDNVIIKSITIKGLKQTATFAQGLADAGNGQGEYTWSIDPATEAAPYNSLVKGESIAITNTKTDDFYPCLVIPQDFSDATMMEVVYVKTVNGSTSGELTSSFKFSEKKYDGVTATKFEAGKKYVYNLIFNTGEIFFTPAIVDWTEVVVSDTVVNL